MAIYVTLKSNVKGHTWVVENIRKDDLGNLYMVVCLLWSFY